MEEVQPIEGVPTTVIRHRKERLSKCSLTPLHHRPEMTFLRARPHFEFDATDFVLLGLDAPVLSQADRGHPLLLLDSTWRLLPRLERCVVGRPVRRSLPQWVTTAYPRVNAQGQDPMGGLASVEALFLARALLGDLDLSLLDGYHWREQQHSSQIDSP